jgi:hypothetical protein
MNELIKQLREKTGLNEDQAKRAAETVIHFLKERVPAISGQLDSVISGSAGDIAKGAGQLFGKH